jgi:ATP-dependent Lon protease
MLNLIEPNNARCYYDKALLTEIDVSHANWVMTANAITSRLPKPFLSRVEIVEVTAPPLDMFEPLVAQLIGTLARRWSLPPDMTPILPASAIATMRADYRRYRSIRRLGQMIERIAAGCLPERRLN